MIKNVVYDMNIEANLPDVIIVNVIASDNYRYNILSTGLYMKVKETGYWYRIALKAGSLRRIGQKNLANILDTYVTVKERIALEQGSGETS